MSNSQLEKIGRTGLKVVKFDTGCGGQAEFTQMDFAHALSGLNNLPTAWAMYAYSNTFDEQSLSYLTARLSKIIRIKHPKIKPKAVIGLVKVTLRDALRHAPGKDMTKSLSSRMRAAAMGIPKSTYHENKKVYEQIIAWIHQVIKEWEKQIVKVVEKHFSH